LQHVTTQLNATTESEHAARGDITDGGAGQPNAVAVRQDAPARGPGAAPSGSRLTDVLERLAAVPTQLGVLEEICSASVQLTGAHSALIATVEDGQVRIAAATGALGPAALPLRDRPVLIAAGTDGPAHFARRLQGLLTPGAPADSPPPRLTPITTDVADGVLATFHPAEGDDDAQASHQADGEVLEALATAGRSALAGMVAVRRSQDTEAHWLAVIDAMADGVAVLDPARLVRHWNQAAARLVGRPPETVVGRPFPLPLGAATEVVEHQLGENRWIELTATELADELVVVLRDISHRKALDAAKTMFVASTGHELKTPLTVIRSFAEWLRGPGETAEGSQRQQALAAIADSAEELQQLVEKILLTARTEAGVVDLSVAVVDPVRLVSAVASTFSVVGRSPGDLVVDLPSALPTVLADRRAVRTVLGQLLENAFKYSPDGGPVRVTARPTESAMVEVSVSDRGIGLTEAETGFLFTAFYQGRSGRTREGTGRGVGLGLSIVRRLVEAMGGRAGAEPLQPGSRFWFTLPCAPPEPADDDSGDTRPGGGQPPDQPSPAPVEA